MDFSPLEPGQERMLSTPKSFSITGYLTPFTPDDQLWFIEIPENPNFWVAVFSTEAKLEKSCAEAGIVGYRIKQITDGRDFIESVTQAGVRIMADPYAVRSENKTRWTEIILE